MAKPDRHQSKTKAQLIEVIEQLEAELAERESETARASQGIATPQAVLTGPSAIKTLIGALNRVDDGVVLYDSDDKLIFCNRAYIDTVPDPAVSVFKPGTSFEKIVRTHVNAGLLKDAIGREEEYIQDRLQRHRNTEGMPPFQFSDGTWYTTSEYLLGDGGRLLVRRNVSEWMAMTRALADNEERFRDFAEASQDWFWEMDADLRFSYFSDRFYWASGVRPEEMLGRTRRESLWDDPDTEPWKSHIADLEAHRAFRDFIHARRRADGVMNYLSISGKPIFDQDGIFKGYRGTGRNITSQWRAENELARAKDAAEAANRSKTEFLANMSHELRTPLNSIIGYSELMIGETFGPIGNEKYADYIGLIQNSGHHLLLLIDDVLDIATIEAGRVAVENNAFDLVDQISVSIDVMRDQADQAGVILESRLETIPPFLGDERRLRQVVLNLLSNAIKFTDGGGRILVELNRINGGGVQIRVSDDGIGIAIADQEKVLTAFGQAEGAFVRRYKGVGLGLPIVKKLTELHDGEMRLESQPGVGTAISLLFPASRLLQDR